MAILSNFSKSLVRLRKEKGLSQSQLALLLGLSRGQIGNYELGTREPDFDTLKSIADHFGVSVDFILGNSDIRRPVKSDDLFDQIGVVIHRDPKPLTKTDKTKLLKIIETAWPVEDNP